MTAKERALEATVADANVERGTRQADQGDLVDQAEARERMAKWIE